MGLCIAHPVATERHPATGTEKYAARWSALYFELKRGCSHLRRINFAKGTLTQYRSILSASNRSVRRGSKERQPPPMNTPARYNMPFSMNEYAQNQCRRRATANMPAPRLM